MSIRLLFDPIDLWIGIYWRSDWEGPSRMFDNICVCIVPMIPIQLSIQTGTVLHPKPKTKLDGRGYQNGWSREGNTFTK